MSESEKTAIAAHLYVTLRRKLNRVIDVEWLVKNEEYARAVIGMARQNGLEELAHYADRMEELIFGKSIPVRHAEPAPVVPIRVVAEELTFDSHEPADNDGSTASQYIGTLR
ncbi:MAG TPA: hypothetical protein VFF74_01070 [Methylophilaceae bacterium]|nr:hypothetical protein [Methylophilaceae bacterium]